MNIIIINIAINWVYRLYEEYINSIKEFCQDYYKDVNIEIVYYNLLDISNFSFNNLHLNKYDKIFYSGDLNMLNHIIQLANNFSKIYYINIEQLSHPSYYTLFRTIHKEINIIDYSEENIPFSKNIYLNSFLFPPYFKEKKNHLIKTIDVMSIVNNQYRENIINNIYLHNYKTLYIDNCYGELRDEYFSRTKIYINIHSSKEHNTMELIRIINLIMNKVIVITDNSINSESLFIKDSIIICNDHNHLKILINEVLKNYNYYYDKIFKNFNNQLYKEYIKKNTDLLFDI
jgi:hypothetical protein